MEDALMTLSFMKFTLIKNLVAMALMSVFLFSPNLHAQNLLKDAVRMNRDLKDNKYKYKHEYNKTKNKVSRAKDNARDLADGSYVDKKLDKMEHNATRKLRRAKDKMDPRDEIAEEMRRDIKQGKRGAVDKWLAD
ncbi:MULTISPECIES: hypothetical protein [Shewanella]|uniref:hypothetical protein n=1 Tax=Shewanella TaxID=22 RepID=UPI001CBA68A2|nr:MULTISPECIES: hypothetical protein [Shewanella]